MSDPTNPASVRVGTWNTKWAVPNRARGLRVRATLADPVCDVMCVTEGSEGLLPKGYVIDGGTDWGYPVRPEDRRKVLLWSRSAWTEEEDSLGSPDVPGGRFVKGVTETRIGQLTVVGVCIPWADAHVRTGRKDRRRWEDHEAWLRWFGRLPYLSAGTRTVVLGDFNQRIPRCGTPENIYRLLKSALGELVISTAGELPGDPGLAIDHIAHTGDLTRRGDVETWPKRNADKEFLSDHFGVWADFALRDRRIV